MAPLFLREKWSERNGSESVRMSRKVIPLSRLLDEIAIDDQFLSDRSNYFDLEPSDNCSDGVKWILDVFADCVDTNVKIAGFWIGFISLLLWFLPLIPQVWENYRLKKCEGLSLYFLLFMLIGDSCNMLGAFLTDQQAIQKIVGVYYILQDCAVLCQFFYYTVIYSRMNKSNDNERNGSRAVSPLSVMFFGVVGGSFLSGVISLRVSLESPSDFVAISPFSRRLLQNKNDKWKPIFTSYVDVVGYALGGLSAMSYLSSRVPQMLKNYERQSCEGLSLLMFCIAIAANVFYGVSVLFGYTGWHYLMRRMPWLVGSLGCCTLDMFIFAQYVYYQRMNAARELVGTEAVDTERLV